jgi:hypothetical protein
MSIHKVIELLAESDKSWEDAAQNAVKEAGKSLKNIRAVNVNNQSCVIVKNKISKFRVNVKVTFEVE